MNNLQINCFLAAAETLNFTAAAEKLFFTQQAVSKSISNLERELGVTLFERDHKSLSITRAGEYYALLFSKHLSRMDEVRKDLSARYQHMVQHMALGYSAWIDPCGEINRGVKAFRGKSPAISLTARQYANTELTAELTSGALDVAFLSEDQVILNNEFEICPIAEEDISLLVPERVCGEDWPGRPDPGGWGVPFLQTMAWEWSYLEKRQIIGKELESLGMSPARVDFLPNIISICTALEVGRCITVGDNIFGLFRKIPGVRASSLGVTSHLCCFWHKLNENPVIPRFVEHMRTFYANNKINGTLQPDENT